jgi:uncharacterized protein YndB with AHSA1/START domain
VNASNVVTGPVTVRVSRQFAASPARVFDAWFQPACLASFLCAAEVAPVLRGEFDPRPGGGFLVATRRDDATLELRGEYLEIQRPERLVFSLRASGQERAEDCVTLELAALGSGCLLVLLHEMDLQRSADRGRVQLAWNAALQRLAGLTSVDQPAIQEPHGAARAARVAWIMRDHADRRAVAVQLGQEVHDRSTIL